MVINAFDSKNKMNCSLTNSKFVFVISTLWQSITDSLYLIKKKGITSAVEILSNTFQQFFPKEPPGLNHLRESNIFYGEFKDQFSAIYFDLLGLWKDLQEERIADISGENIKINPVGLEKILLDSREKLETVLKKIFPKAWGKGSASESALASESG